MEQQKIAIMQPYFFPYLGYFQLISAADIFILYGKVSFRKKSWITRNRILDKGTGEPVFFRIPVKKQSSFKLIDEIEIDNTTNWRKVLVNLLYFNYKKAFFFEEVYPQVSNLISIESDFLHDYNSQIVRGICSLLGINTAIIHEDKCFASIEEGLMENALSNGVEVKTQRIIELCKKEKAFHYLNPIGGTELYDKDTFLKNNLQLSFVESNISAYSQFDFPYVPYLSILDMLMHKGIQQTKEEINHYNLK